MDGIRLLHPVKSFRNINLWAWALFLLINRSLFPSDAFFVDIVGGGLIDLLKDTGYRALLDEQTVAK